jgi:ribonuclease R
MCNAEGGRLLKESGALAVQPVYRVQEGPDPARLQALAAMTESLAQLWSLPAARWAWNMSIHSLNDWLAQLPPPGPTTEGRIARALARQAVLVNLRSSYAITPGIHAGVGAEPYARFSAPMRELVGVYLHKEASELLTGQHPDAAEDEVLRAQVVAVANESRAKQKQVQNFTNEVVLDRLFSSHLATPVATRPTLDATVMGISKGKVHVQLDSPPLDLKLYFYDLSQSFKGAWLEPSADGCTLNARGQTKPLLTLGQHLRLTVKDKDSQTKRWRFTMNQT